MPRLRDLGVCFWVIAVIRSAFRVRGRRYDPVGLLQHLTRQASLTIVSGPMNATIRCVDMDQDRILRAAYDAGLVCGRSIAGLPDQCPFNQITGLAERIAWLSGFSVGKAVRVTAS